MSSSRPFCPRRAVAPLAACLLAAFTAAASAWEAEAVLDVAPAAALVANPPPQLVQMETTSVAAQVAVSDAVAIVDGLSLSGTAWAMANSLPSGSPLSVPAAKVDVQSRLLELRAAWEIVQGTLIWSVGKTVIHPSSGFFKAPLNLMARPAVGSTAAQSGAAVGKWEEGWIGTEVTWLLPGITVADFFCPRITWSHEADAALRYLSLPQGAYQNLTRIGLRIGEVDLRILGLVSTGGPGSADPDLHLTAGAGFDTNIGESVTVRGEISAADAAERLIVVDGQPLPSSVAADTPSWAPRALFGVTWANAEELSVMAEYYYNGLGFQGSDYRDLITYSRNRRDSGAAIPDVAGQFGTFEAARHYGFMRIAGKLEHNLAAEGWIMTNLQDLSAMTGLVLTLSRDSWQASGSLVNAWGRDDTEAGAAALLWKLDFELSFFL